MKPLLPWTPVSLQTLFMLFRHLSIPPCCIVCFSALIQTQTSLLKWSLKLHSSSVVHATQTLWEGAVFFLKLEVFLSVWVCAARETLKFICNIFAPFNLGHNSAFSCSNLATFSVLLTIQVQSHQSKSSIKCCIYICHFWEAQKYVLFLETVHWPHMNKGERHTSYTSALELKLERARECV